MEENYYELTPLEAMKLLGASQKGLSAAEAKKRLEESGYNELQKGKKASTIILFLRQFTDFLILLLIFATIISLALGEVIDAIAMFSIVFLSALLGFTQEYKAEKAIEALEKISAPTARIIRNGKEMKIAARLIVPGDLLLLESGDIVPADSRIIEESSLQIDEASLTGESVPSKKFTQQLRKETSISDQENMAFMGTVVTYGKGKAVITGTGMSTEFGKIAESLKATKETKTPLQLKFEQMSKQIGFAVISLVFIVFIAGLLRKEFTILNLFIFSLSLAVAAVPSSLPAIVTIGLSMGAKLLAKKSMIIKRLPAAESLGATTIICSDKTGTITKNQMTVTDIYYDHRIISVSGSGYEPKGEFSENSKTINPKELELLLRIGYLCNNAKLSHNNGKFEIIGDPTEGSLIVLGKKGNLDEHHLNNFKLLKELPFDSERKRMSVIFKNKSHKKIEAYVKGAPDLLLKACGKIIKNGKITKLTKKDRSNILKTNERFASKALRVLGLAYGEISGSKEYSIKNVESNLIFVGLAGMIDPPRDGVKEAVQKCRGAGIKVMIITGDHALTTKAIAKEIGLFKEGDVILTGDELEKMSEHELEQRVDKIRIIARALPIQKSRVVDALQKKGHIVAMTGDGVNDAPALKKADIGIAMGITGTDVAKEVSKATLADDNFSTIVNAIHEGRNIYDKIIKSTRYLLSCNMGEIITVFIAIILKFPLPLIPLQILLMNLITDGLPALGLGAEPSDADIMKRPPRNPKEKPINFQMLSLIIIFGLVMGAGTLFLFNSYIKADLKLAQTVAFTCLVMFEMFAVMGSRSLSPLKKLNPFSNLWLLGGVLSSILIQIAVIYLALLQPIFGTVPLAMNDWLKIIAVSSIGFVIMEASKFFLKTKTSPTEEI